MTDRRSVLILGAAQMQIPAITIAKGKGWTVVVADRDESAPGVPFADEFLHVDLSDRYGMAEAAERYRKKDRLDGVFTAGTDFSATVAWVAEKLGLPGIPYQVAINASDKAKMRAVFSRAGLPSPPFVRLESADDWRVAADRLELPLVVKPVDNMGARGVRRVDTPAELEAAVSHAVAFSRCGSVIVESYLDGPEFSLDAIVYRGTPVLCGIADRHIRFAPYFVEMGHTMPTNADEPLAASVTDVFFRGIRALGIDNGAAKGDIKLTSDGPYIGEIAARLSGGYMSGWTFPYASGVEVTDAALNIAVGDPPGDLTPKRDAVSAERAFISIPGTVAAVERTDEVREQAGVRDLFVRVSPGDAVTFPTNNVEKCGNVIASAGTREATVEAAERACRTVFVRLRPDDPQTQAFLFGRREPWIPDAFVIDVPENRRTFAEMPSVSPSGTDVARRRPLEILGLPRIDDEVSTDWHGETFGGAFRRVVALTGAVVRPAGASATAGNIAVGRKFWLAFLRGGVQGGVWALETVRSPG